MSILVVDDDPEIVSLLVQTINSKYAVVGVGSGVEALGALSKQKFAAVVTDQRMPGMTGVELARQVHLEDPLLSVVLLTAYTDPADVIAAINDGEVFRYVTKPWNISDLLLTVKAAVERTQLARENSRLVGTLNRQISAITLVGDVGRALGVVNHSVDVFAHLLRCLPGVLDFSVAAAVVVGDRSQLPALHIHSAVPLDEPTLTEVRDVALLRFNQVTKQQLSVGDLVVRVAGGEGADPAEGSIHDWHPIDVSIASSATSPLGVIAVWSRGGERYADEDARLLSVIANEIALLLAKRRDVVQSEQRYFNEIMSALVDGVIVANLDGSITLLNSAARGFLGMMPDSSFSPEAVWDLLGYSPRRALATFEDEGPAPVRFSCEVLRRAIVGVVSPVFDNQRCLVQVAFTLRDLSEEQSYERKKDDLIATVSHELKTPLVSVLSAIELVLEQYNDSLPSEASRHLYNAREAAKRMTRLLTDMLDLSRHRIGHLSMRSDKVDCRKLLETIADAQRAVAEKRAIEIVVEIHSESLDCDGEEVRIGQIIDNLLSNAIKFATDGSTIRIIADYTATKPRYVFFSVWNEGPEIPRHERAKIFRRFEQGSTAALVKQRGSGLGLSIASSLVEAHRGFLDLTSGEGQGTTFCVALPCERPGDDTLPVQNTPNQDVAMQRSGQRVLVVDDEVNLAHFLRLFLSSLGFDVTCVTSADDAIAKAREENFALIITDINMPNVDGLVLTEAIRHDPMTRRTPVIVYSLSDQGEAALHAGALGFFSKPLALAALRETMDQAFLHGASHRTAILVVDPEHEVRRVASQVFANLGHRVYEAADFTTARASLTQHQIDVALVASELSEGDGIDLMSAWRHEHPSAGVITLFLAKRANTADKVRALKAGADDYLQKPIDALELAARVDSSLRRRDREVSASPTTRLPGSHAIEREVSGRLETGEGFLLCYFDLDNFKAFNDVYGYAKADAVIGQTGDIFREVVSRFGSSRDFIGHVAGDDFVCVFTEASGERLCKKIVQSFDKIIPLYYDIADRKRGHIEAEDRYGQRRQFPIISLSVAAIKVGLQSHTSYAALSAEVAEIKKRAKSISGSAFLLSIDGQPAEVRALVD